MMVKPEARAWACEVVQRRGCQEIACSRQQQGDLMANHAAHVHCEGKVEISIKVSTQLQKFPTVHL